MKRIGLPAALSALGLLALGLLALGLLAPPRAFSREIHTLNLESAVNLALAKNETVLAARAKIAEKRADRSAALSTILPSVNLGGSYTRLGRVPQFSMVAVRETVMALPVYDTLGQPIGVTMPIPVPIGADTVAIPMGQSNNYDLRGSVTQILFTGGKVLNALSIARYSLGIEHENYRKTVADVKFNVSQAFYQVLTAREGAKLVGESYRQMERHVVRVDQLYQAGYISKLDLLRARVALANLRTQFIQAENGYALSQAVLKLAIGMQPDDSVAVEGELGYRPEPGASVGGKSAHALDSALAARPEVRILENTLGISEAALHIEEANFLPNLFAAFNYDYQKPVSLGSNSWGTNWNLTFGFSLPVFSGFSRVSKVLGRRQQLKQVGLGLAQLKKGIAIEIESARLTLNQQEEMLKGQRENQAQADEAMRIAEEQYRSGVISNLEYMDTQVAQLQAHTQHLAALSGCLIARAKLAKALGQ